MFGLLATLVFAAITAIQAQTFPSGCDRTATVVAGDTCGTICAQHSVSTYQLAAVNAAVINADCTNIYAGEILCIGITGQDCDTIYVSQSGDTCVSIANDNNIPESTLLANNPNLSTLCTNLFPGEVLCVSSTVYPYGSS